MKKGIVLELKKDYAVIGSEGRYKRVKRKDNMELGQEIIYLEEDLIEVKRQAYNFGLQKLVPALTALVIVMMIVFNYYTENLRIYAVVTVDINPSIELKLNKNQEVVEAVAINDDAEKLDLKSFEGVRVEDVVERIIESSKDEGFIVPDKETYIMITTVNTRDQVETYDNIKATLETSIDLISMEEKVNIGLGESTVELLEEAEETQVPLALLEVRDELDEDVDSVEDLFENQEVKAFIESQGKIVEVEVELDDDGVEIEISLEDDLDDDLDDLLELLAKLEQVPEDEEEILEFVEDAYKGIDSGNVNVKEIKALAKGYWLSVKDLYDIDDDDDLDDLLKVLDELDKYKDQQEVEDFINKANEAIDNKSGNYDSLEDEGEDLLDIIEDSMDMDDDLDDLLEVLEELDKYKDQQEVEDFIQKANEAIDNKSGNYDALEDEGEDLLDIIEDSMDMDDDDLDDLLEVLEDLDKYKDQQEVEDFIKKANEAIDNKSGNYDALEDEGEDLLDIIEDSMDIDDDDDMDDDDDNDMDDDDDNDMDDDDDNDMDDDDDNDMDDDDDNDMDDNDMDDDDDNDMDDDDDNDIDDDMDELDDLLEVLSKLDAYTSFEHVESFINRANEAIDNKTGGYEALEDEGKELLDFVEDLSEEVDSDNEFDDEDDEEDEEDEEDDD